MCGGEAMVIFITVDKHDVRCSRCGKYIFRDGLNEADYKDLPLEKKEIISKYVKEYNKATNEWAQLGDIDELWMKIEQFNRSRKKD